MSKKENDIRRLIVEAEDLVIETKRLVKKGWERQSRLKEAEEYLEGLKRMLKEASP